MACLYEQEVSKHGKRDAMIVLGFFMYFIMRDFAVSIGYSQYIAGGNWQILEDWRLVIAVTCIIDILIVLAIVKVRKQSLASVGLHKKNLWAAIGLGLLFAPIFLITRVVPGVTGGWELYSLGSFMFALINVMLWAFREDISFVGFIQTRLYGLVKNDTWAVNLGAALFTLAHIPSRLVQGVPMANIGFILLLANWFFMHRAFVLLFKRHFSIVPVFIMHTAANFPRLWQGEGGVRSIVTIGVTTIVFCVAVEVWHRRWSEKSHSAL